MNRREMVGASLLVAMAGAASAAPLAGQIHTAPNLEFAFAAHVTLGAPLEQGTFAGARRRIVPISGGTVDGPRFQGVVLAGGADWQAIREGDGNTQIYARYSLRHEDGTIVSVTNPGVRRGPASVMAKLAAGEIVDPALYYFRASPQFEVQPGPHGWLAENTFVCVGKRWPDRSISTFIGLADPIGPSQRPGMSLLGSPAMAASATAIVGPPWAD